MHNWNFDYDKLFDNMYIPIGTLVVAFIVYKLINLLRIEPAVEIQVPLPAAAKQGYKADILLEPSIIDPSDPGKIVCYDPSTAKQLDVITSATESDVDAAIQRAKKAQIAWAKTSFAERRRVLKTLLNWIVTNQKDIAAVACRDTGKTMIDAAFGEIIVTVEKIRWTLAYGEKVLKPQSRSAPPMLAYKKAIVQYEPKGVVAALVSWNYPFHNMYGPIISALFAGNAIVVKGSELVAWSTKWYEQGIKTALSQCGHDPELVQTIVCLPDVAPSITQHPDISHVTFIGSEQVGRHVAAAAVKNLTQVTLELGGKDAAILLPSFSKSWQAKFSPTFMRSVFQGCGQNCIGSERFIVHEGIYDHFVADLSHKVGDLKIGSGLDDSGQVQVDVGACISDRNFGRLEDLVSSAVSQGARLIHGGKRITNHPIHPQGHYFAPTLLVDVTPSMQIAQEECFAPIMLVLKYSDLDEAIEIANGSRFGLGASVYGSNKSEAKYVASKLKVGMVAINDFGTFYLCQSMPFGGVKQSGYGRFAGEEGLQAMCDVKSISIDRFFGIIQTGIPPPVDYPITNPDKAWGFVSGLVQLMYGSLVQRVGGLWRLASSSV